MVKLSQQRSSARQARAPRRHLTRQKVDVVLISRENVGLTVFIELKPVFHVPQELVGVAQARIFRGREQVLVAQPGESQKSSPVPHPGLAPSMKALQALHQE